MWWKPTKPVSPQDDTAEIEAMLQNGDIHMVTFTSSSTVTNFIHMFPTDKQEALRKWMEKVHVACIGPITANTAREQGFSVALTPSDYTIEALTQEISNFFQP